MYENPFSSKPQANNSLSREDRPACFEEQVSLVSSLSEGSLRVFDSESDDMQEQSCVPPKEISISSPTSAAEVPFWLKDSSKLTTVSKPSPPPPPPPWQVTSSPKRKPSKGWKVSPRLAALVRPSLARQSSAPAFSGLQHLAIPELNKSISDTTNRNSELSMGTNCAAATAAVAEESPVTTTEEILRNRPRRLRRHARHLSLSVRVGQSSVWLPGAPSHVLPEEDIILSPLSSADDASVPSSLPVMDNLGYFNEEKNNDTNKQGKQRQKSFRMINNIKTISPNRINTPRTSPIRGETKHVWGCRVSPTRRLTKAEKSIDLKRSSKGCLT